MASKTSGKLDRSPVHLLHRASQAVEEIFQAEIGDSDLTPRQLAVLATVAGNEGSSQTDIVNLTGIDRSTLADIVSRLVKKGLLQRRRTKQDARAYAVKLTEEGQRVLRAAGPVGKKVDQLIAKALGGGRDAFLEGLKGMVEKLQPGSTG
jgi:DNA-binding MarR family transcriptional regulator